MDTYCWKCRKRTPSTNVEHIKTANNKWRLKATCAVCKHEKSTFTKAPESSSVIVESKPVTGKARLIEAKELHRSVVKKYPKRRIVTLGIDELWAADLVIMDKYASENDNYKYMLNVIDTFSKYAWSEPLTRKSGSHVTQAFKVIIKRAYKCGHKPPNLLHVDKGCEFVNKEFKSTLESYNIKMYHTENEQKSAIVERFNRSLNELMKVQFEVRQSYRWVDILQGLIQQYNNRVHRTICMKPSEVTSEFEDDLKRMYDKQMPSPTGRPKLKVGDRVRITAKKDCFANKYKRNWTREIFIVFKVLNTSPITYRIRDQNGEEVLGSFYEKELQKSKL